MWVSGLRGAMAYALALKSHYDLPGGDVILTLTLIIAQTTVSLWSKTLNRSSSWQPPCSL